MDGLTPGPSARGERYAPIADHGVIGDSRTAALVALDGTLDFLCLPEFDSPTVFAALLDAERGGAFAIAPVEGAVGGEQRYVRDTNVLVTRFATKDGDVELVDFMPVDRAPSTTRIVRMVRAAPRGWRGRGRLRMRCMPRFDYGRVSPVAELTPSGATFTGAGIQLHLTSSVPLTLIDGGRGAEAVFDVEARHRACFVLEHVQGRVSGRGADALDARWAARALRRTIVFWRRWIAPARYDGQWRSAVRRSALVLKLLQSRCSGAIVAAPTFGLPEQIGGARNWDFRYAWIRDASFIAYAFVRLGMRDPSNAFTRWAVARCEDARHPGELQSFYGIDGRRTLTETTLDHLEGHRGSRPVRIGNAAFEQLQLDIHGELIDALYLRDVHNEPTPRALWRHVVALTDWVCRNWQRADQGIWEVRGSGQEFLYSRVMCWVAVDRALRLAGRRGFEAPREAWRATRDAIRGDVHDNFWNARIGAFVGSKGSASVDAACLVMPLVGFIPVSDQRWRSTLRVVETRLVRDGLVRRYDMTGMDTEAGSLTAPAFTACSFWYAECLARGGEMEKARATMRQLLARANHLGLFAEDIGADGSQLGNFPLGLTHAALIGAAFAISTTRMAETA
jgi:GH15 family glucan-1,4-alpha-glucosidase